MEYIKNSSLNFYYSSIEDNRFSINFGDIVTGPNSHLDSIYSHLVNYLNNQIKTRAHHLNVTRMLRPIKFDSFVNNLHNKCDEFANFVRIYIYQPMHIQNVLMCSGFIGAKVMSLMDQSLIGFEPDEF